MSNQAFRVAIGPSSFADEDPTPLRALECAGADVRPNPFGRRLNETEIIRHLDGIDGLIAGLEPLNRKVLAASKQLKAIARVGIGMDNVDLTAAAELGIKVSNTPEGPTEAVAEMTVAALLALCRQIIPANAALHGGEWKKIIGASLRGALVLLIGFGRIGQKTAQLLKPFGVELMATDERVPDGPAWAGVRRVTLADGLRAAEIISLHAAGRARILGPEEFAAMRPGVILLNSARGGLIDEAALIAALDSGKVSRAWLDVFDTEPYNGPLLKYSQVLLTPHVSTYTRQCRFSMEMTAVRNLLRDLGVSCAPHSRI